MRVHRYNRKIAEARILHALEFVKNDRNASSIYDIFPSSIVNITIEKKLMR